ncbi:GNAT family N-acetyltransferase [Salinactinospora qingdaonensis]|uniref:N-acetyltransferase domain-containing protein n=1 Tax=Salinactinospora qingdaonensis TaxID=702744 RepID=A0ABP7F8H3_9ACTN
MIIRAAIRSDLGAILRLLRDVGAGPHARPSTVRMSSAAVRAWTRIETDPDRTVLVAERRGQIIGTLDLIVIANLTHDAQSWAVVGNIVVDAACRLQGVGRALLEDAVDRATRAGCYKIQLMPQEDSVDTRGFYHALGFAGATSGFCRYL